MENEVIYNVEKINSITSQMKTLISDSSGATAGVTVPESLVGETMAKLEKITELYSKLFSVMSEDLLEKISDYASQKSNDMSTADNQ